MGVGQDNEDEAGHFKTPKYSTIAAKTQYLRAYCLHAHLHGNKRLCGTHMAVMEGTGFYDNIFLEVWLQLQHILEANLK